MSASARPPDIPGYRYLRQLAVGGYSVVYLYAQDSPKREVAVKVLKDVGQILLDQLVDEANAMARLGNHPNIVQVLATAVASDGQHYIVMPYCSGPNLLALAQRGGFDGRKVLRVGVQIARAVEASHRAGFVHRDIKPANILTDEYGTPRLTDFGIAGRLVPDDQAEEVGISVPWSPPEILAGGAGSVASDVYSLGATLWNLLVGHSPFEVAGRNSRPEVAARIRRVPAPPTGRTDVPVAVEALLARMLAKQPAGRPPSAEDVARELGLAQSAIYWYFETKDHLFVAAVERILHDILARKPRKGTCVDEVIWFAERLGDFRDLRIAMRERARASEVVATFESNTMALLRVMLANALSAAVDANALDDTTDAVMALCEGALLRDISKAKRARLIRFGFDRLVTQR